MAKREQYFRLMSLAEIFKRKPQGVTYEEIYSYLERKFEEKGWLENFKFSEKTFKREREELLEILGIETVYKRSTNSYKIVEDELETETVFDNILLIDAYRKVKGNSEIMLFEKRKSRGLEHLNGILHAIQNKKIISFNYTKYWDEIPQKRVLEPYALKEFRYCWYLLANEKNGKDFQIKTFGLDRISDFEISSSSFKKENFNPNEVFQNSFGIISTLHETPEEIVISFTSHQGKYIKSLPLHHSQEILIDDENELRIKLNLVPTFDFEQELLQHSEHFKIISPKNFKDRMNEIWKNSLRH